MSNITIHDVQELCQKGALRAYANGGRVYLEDTASKEAVRLDGKAAEVGTGPMHKDKNRTRVENMFGSRDTWPCNADEGQGPYKGFLLIECEECGKVHAYCAKRETFTSKCECGHVTTLENLRPVFMHCKCGQSYRYRTNITRASMTHTCMDCKAPVDLELNKKETAYVTVGIRR